jgi:hypothetical protein
LGFSIIWATFVKLKTKTSKEGVLAHVTFQTIVRHLRGDLNHATQAQVISGADKYNLQCTPKKQAPDGNIQACWQ